MLIISDRKVTQKTYNGKIHTRARGNFPQKSGNFVAMKEVTPFRFKQFQVSHSRSSMRVGVDGVLLGAWATVPAWGTVLDVGTGCGLIALMCAQRSEGVRVTGIDVDAPSVEEAAANFAASPWSERLEARLQDFMSMTESGSLQAIDKPVGRESGYDLIVSNPPYFDAGVGDPGADARLRARHVAEFGPVELLRRAPSLLSPGGRLAMIVPADWLERLRSDELRPVRLCRIYGSARRQIPNRLLIEFSRETLSLEETDLRIHEPDGSLSATYHRLTDPFYL